MLKAYSWIFISVAVSACSSNGGESTQASTDTVYDLGVNIEGLEGEIEILIGAGGHLEASEDGRFWFKGLAAGTHYTITVATQPDNQVCEIENETGVIGSNIEIVNVSCSYETLWAGEQRFDRLNFAYDIDLADDAWIHISGYGSIEMPFLTAKIFSRYPNGVHQWRYIHDKAPSVIFDLAHDDEGFIYGVGNDLTNPNGIEEFGYKDALIVKIDSSGQLVWDRSIGGAEMDLGYSVVAASIDRVYMAGITESATFEGNNTDRTPHIYVVALDSSTGETVWSYVKEASDLEGVPFVSLDADKNLILTYAAAEQETSVNTQLLKLNASGEVVWQKEYGGNGKDIPGREVLIDSQGNMFLSGRTDSDDFLGQSSNSFNSVFLVKLTSAGDVLWSRRLGDVNTEYYLSDVALGIEDEIILAINDLGESRRAILSNWDNSGEKKWEKVIDSSRIDSVSGLAIDNEGDMFIIGRPLSSTSEEFLLKLNPEGEIVE